MVVPFSGVPVQGRGLVLARPKLTLVNSHFNARYAAEHAWGLLLVVVKKIVQADREMRRGIWAIRYTDAGITVLRGSTCGIVGYGAVGRELARLARAFEMRVLAIRRTPDGATGGLAIFSVCLSNPMPSSCPSRQALLEATERQLNKIVAVTQRPLCAP